MLKHLSCLIVLFLVGTVAAQQPIRLITYHFPPYSFGSGDRIEGAAVDLVRCIFSRLGQALTLESYPFSEVQARVERGEADGYFPASRNAERDRLSVQTRAFIPQSWVFYVRPSTVFDPTLRPAPGEVRIGVVATSNMMHHLQKEGWPVTLRASLTGDLLTALLKNEVDAVLVNMLVMENQVHQTGVAGRVRYIPYLERPMGVYISRRYLAERPDFLPRFNAETEICE